jgi:hypothetical protein
MIVAHIAGVPVEETLQPLAIALLLSGAWITARLRRPFESMRKERTPSDGTR